MYIEISILAFECVTAVDNVFNDARRKLVTLRPEKYQHENSPVKIKTNLPTHLFSTA